MTTWPALIATDLDGTLWDGGERIHPGTLRALASLAEAGIAVVAATGRRPRTAQAVLARHGVALPGVFLDGSVVLAADGAPIRRASFPADVAAAVLAAFTAAGVAPMLAVARHGIDLVLPPTYPGSATHLDHNRAVIAPGPLAPVIAAEPVLAFVVIGGDIARLTAVQAAIGPTAAASLTLDRVYGGATLQVRPPGITKWSGVLAYCDHLGIDPTRVLAVGDAPNDLELLTGAATACAMADAAPGVLAIADHILPPASTDGWSHLPALLRASRQGETEM